MSYNNTVKIHIDLVSSSEIVTNTHKSAQTFALVMSLVE